MNKLRAAEVYKVYIINPNSINNFVKLYFNQDRYYNLMSQ